MGCKLCKGVCKEGSSCRRLFSCKRYWSGATNWLNKLVNRRAVTSFALFEFLVSCVVLFFYIWFGPVSGVARFLAPNVVFLVLFCFTRTVSAAVGAAAAWLRLVTRTRVYWGLLVANFVLSIPVIVPLWSCRCECSYNPGGWQIDESQCAALESFQWFPRWLRPDAQTLMRAGAPAAFRGLDGGMRSMEESWLQRLPELLPSAAAPIDRRLEASQRASAMRERTHMLAEAQENEQLAKQDAEEAQAVSTVPENAPEDLQQALQSFNILDAGLILNTTQAVRLDLDGKCMQPEEVGQDQGIALRRLQCSGAAGVSDSPAAVQQRLFRALRDCLGTDCFGVELRISRRVSDGKLLYSACGLNHTVVPAMSLGGIELATTCQLASWDCNSTPIGSAECEEFSVFHLRKQQDPPMPSALDHLRPYCQVIRGVVLILLAVLTLLVFPMSIVIFKYFAGHCGDAFDMGPQMFDIEPSGSNDEDDWNVGTWISIPGAAKKKKRTRTRDDGGSGDRYDRDTNTETFPNSSFASFAFKPSDRSETWPSGPRSMANSEQFSDNSIGADSRYSLEGRAMRKGEQATQVMSATDFDLDDRPGLRD